jgi:amidase
MSLPVTRRGFVAASLPMGAALGSQAPTPGRAAVGADGLDPLDVLALQAEMAAGRLTAVGLTRHCMRRIHAMDHRGVKLNAVIEINTGTLARAKALDVERKQGRLRGPLHGIPVLLKDNIATADGMATSAGSLALQGLHAARDAHLVTRLRAAGAIILGKTNLSEWANIRSSRSTSGWSSRGGQTRNPHVLTRNPSGSSSGSAVAVAAGYCVVAVGTETDGSITSPASVCGVVGLKPTVGLVSRHGVIPISASQDTAGPMTRHVRDAALLLQVLAGPDAEDPATAAQTTLTSPAAVPDYLAGLRLDALQGARIGVIRKAQPPQPQVGVLFEQALGVLRAQGAVLVDPLDIPGQARYEDTELTVLLAELKEGLPKYLRTFQPDAPIRDLASLIAWNRAHAAQTMPFFDQELFDAALAGPDVASDAYRDALATNRRFARTEGLDRLFADHRLDAVVAPTGNLAWPTDPLLGDHFTAGGFTSPFAVAGYPHLSVPMGLVADLPVGLSFGALAWQEGRLLAMGFAYEQASQRRIAPRFLQSAALA